MNWYKKIILAGLPVYNLKEFIKKLQDEFGVQFIRHGKGDDQIWGVPGTNKKTPIPFGPGNRTINPFTLTKMLKHLQIPLQDFKKRNVKQKEVAPQEALPTQPEEIPEWQKQPWYQQQQQITTSANFNLSRKKDTGYNSEQLNKGIQIELEHNNSKEIAKSIAKDHLDEFPNYYQELDKMEEKLEDKKAARGLYNQQQGDEYNQQAGDEMILDWLGANKDELEHMKALAQQHRFKDMDIYGEDLIQNKGFDRELVRKIMTAAMHKVKL